MTRLEQRQVSGTTWEIHPATELFCPIIVRNTEFEHTDSWGRGWGGTPFFCFTVFGGLCKSGVPGNFDGHVKMCKTA